MTVRVAIIVAVSTETAALPAHVMTVIAVQLSATPFPVVTAATDSAVDVYNVLLLAKILSAFKKIIARVVSSYLVVRAASFAPKPVMEPV